MNAANAEAQARQVLEKLVQEINNARTLHYEGRVLHPNGIPGQKEDGGSTKLPDTQQKYYLHNENGNVRVRVESSAIVFGMGITTIGIKNEDGIWQILADQACEISRVFNSHQLLGYFPFFRLSLCFQYPYELGLSGASRDGVECSVITGKLADAPGADAPDIAREFTYVTGKGDGRLYSIHELTFGRRSLDLELDRLELNRALEPVLFSLGGKPRIMVSSFEQYMELRNQDMTKRLRA